MILDGQAADLRPVPQWVRLLDPARRLIGVEVTVAATSTRQASAAARKNVWIDPADAHPVGIVAIYGSEVGTTLWCGCTGHHVEGSRPKHGPGVRALRQAIASHVCDVPSTQHTKEDRSPTPPPSAVAGGN